MKTINSMTISVILIALMTNSVLGYAGMGGNISGTGNVISDNQENIDLANATQSDQDIFLIQHLIEVDAARFESENRIYVRETLIFMNDGDKVFSSTLRTWVPDSIENLRVGKVAMMMGSSGEPLNALQNGNIISWQDVIKARNLSSLYAVEYVVPAESTGTFTKSKHYTKKFLFPTLINKVPLNIVLKVTKGTGENIVLKDELGGTISSTGKPSDEDNSVLYTWEDPQFKEINVEISKSAIDPPQLAPYLIIALIIVLVLAYPVIRKKSTRIQETEEKIRNALKRKPSGEEEGGTDEYSEEELEKGSEEAAEDIEPEEEPAPEDKELSGKTGSELEAEKNELVSKLEEIKKDYASGNLIDEEYEELRNSYQEKLNKIQKRIN